MPCCGHDTHGWIHAKAALRAVDVTEPGRCQCSRVLGGVAEVEDEYGEMETQPKQPSVTGPDLAELEALPAPKGARL
jgi:hypothetical protein